MPPIIEELRGKKIAILGFGREGRSTYSYIRSYLPDQMLTIADLNPVDTQGLYNVETIIGESYQKLHDFDIIMKSPGIVMMEHIDPFKLNSQTNLFLKHYRQQTIGITGTKGKSTTSTLLFHMLKENGKKVVLLGNIGTPAFDELEHIDENTMVVYELSCHQLEYAHYSPHIAVLLNIYEEHLDHYGNYESYILAKEQIWRHQSSEDVLLCEKSLVHDEMSACIITLSMSETANIMADVDKIQIDDWKKQVQPHEIPLIGQHNLYDVGVDLYLAQRLGISFEDGYASIKSFIPLPHRLQYLGKFHQLHWYDDSISTICETTIFALKSLPMTSTLILGGMDRGIDYAPLVNFLKKCPHVHIVLMPDTGAKIAKNLCNPYTFAQNLQEAVEIAKRVTETNGTVLLSPAAASYGFFKDFHERGQYYQRYIKENE